MNLLVLFRQRFDRSRQEHPGRYGKTLIIADILFCLGIILMYPENGASVLASILTAITLLAFFGGSVLFGLVFCWAYDDTPLLQKFLKKIGLIWLGSQIKLIYDRALKVAHLPLAGWC